MKCATTKGILTLKFGDERLRGFTLIELMVTLAVMAILLMIAVPSFQDATLSSKLSSYANSLVSSAHLARGEAIKRNSPVTLCVATSDTSTDCGTGGWEQGWIVRTTDGTVVQRQQALPAGLKITGGSDSLVFQPSGVGATSADFTVCRATPTVGTQERVVSISATGRPSVKKPTTVSTCS
jgi:type IV fimbrial biogenesis protein FimT